MDRKLPIFLALLLASSPAGVTAAAKPQSTSASRQFIVYGADIPVRGAVCDLAETTKAGLLKLLQMRDNWKTPLVINLDYPQANLPERPAARLDFSQIGSGLKLQLNLLLTGELEGRAVQRQILRAILIEMIYRARPEVAVGTQYMAPPDWLLDGFLQLLPGRASDEAAHLLRTILAGERIASLEEVVRQRRDLLEPAPQKIHDALSLALVQLLLEARDGPRKLSQFLADLPDAPNDPMADLQAHFPGVLGRSAGKWWTLSVARLSATDRYEILSAPETAERLDRLLRLLSIPGPDGVETPRQLSDYANFLKLPASRLALRRLQQQLLLLGARAHPSYRAIIQEFADVVGQLARGKTGRIDRRLAHLASYRAVVEDEERSREDYLNWYEATQLESMSGAFAGVLKSANDKAVPPRRRDPISVYLDTIEEQMK